MKDLKLQPGDIFCSTNPMALGRAINAVQWFWSKDKESRYSHSGIILDYNGKTLEALWRFSSQNLYTAYAGDNIIVGRHTHMTPEYFATGYAKIEPDIGAIYPFWKLPLFLLPPLTQFLNFTGKYVCSVRVMQFLFYCSLVNRFTGYNPDDVADMIRTKKGWEIVFEGKLE